MGTEARTASAGGRTPAQRRPGAAWPEEAAGRGNRGSGRSGSQLHSPLGRRNICQNQVVRSQDSANPSKQRTPRETKTQGPSTRLRFADARLRLARDDRIEGGGTVACEGNLKLYNLETETCETLKL